MLEDSSDWYKVKRGGDGCILKVLIYKIHEPAEQVLVIHASTERHREHVLARDLAKCVLDLIVRVFEIVINALAIAIECLSDRLQTVHFEA